jgi:hypothetical protein
MEIKMYKNCSKCKEDKLLSAFSKSRANKGGYQNQCKLCVSIFQKEYQKKYRELHKDTAKEYALQYYEANKTELKSLSKEYYELNKDKLKPKRRKYNKSYRKSNLARMAAKSAKRRAIKLQATPIWLTEQHVKEIEEFYKQSQLLKSITGEEHHVDHIIPLQGKNVCGLHVPWNLQVITAKENLSKYNKILQE